MNATTGPRACADAADVRGLLARWSEDSLDAASHRRLTAHLAACPVCAREAAAFDPVAAFLLLADGASDAGASPTAADAREAGLVAGAVRRAIEVETARRRLSPPRRRVPPAVLRLAASLVLATGVVGALVVSRPPESLRTATTTAGPAPAVSAVRRPLIESVDGGRATIYEFAAEKSGDPSVVFVVDPGADL